MAADRSLIQFPLARIAEIRQENHGGDVSAADIAWLLEVAERTAWLVAAPYGRIQQRHFYLVRETLNGR